MICVGCLEEVSKVNEIGICPECEDANNLEIAIQEEELRESWKEMDEDD